jgi:hypothetical protein
MRAKPSRAQPAVSCSSSLSQSRSSIALPDLCRALRAAPTFSGSISVNGCPMQRRGTASRHTSAAAKSLPRMVGSHSSEHRALGVVIRGGASSLSLAMGLTTILTTIWVRPSKYAHVQIHIFKENWTSEDLRGHAADVWGSKSHEFLSRPAAAVMILPITADLVSRVKAGSL